MRSVPLQVEEEIAVYREELPLILGRLGLHPRRAIWIVPTDVFQLAHYNQRPRRHEVLAAGTDPEQAWRNWMARDSGFARAVAAQAQDRRDRLLTVDGTQSIAANIRTLETWFRLPHPDSDPPEATMPP